MIGVLSRQYSYVRVFLARYGLGPWRCVFCDTEVQGEWEAPEYGDRLAVHHINHNHDDHDPDNLAAAHRRCHNQFHGRRRYATLLAT